MNIFIPIDIAGSIKKSQEEGNGVDWYIRGFASTPDLDLQGDIVQPSGIDINYFKSSGWINYEHQQDAGSTIGVPTDNCYIDFQKGLFVEAKLFKDHPLAQEMWNLANNIEKSGAERKLGFSIEGGIRKRNDRDNRIIEDLEIRNIAVTKNPANPKATWEKFMKSWTTGTEINPEKQVNGEALRVEQLAQAITNLTWTYKIGNPQELDKTWEGVSKYMEASDRNSAECGIIMLQLSRGISRLDAEKFVNKKLEN